jgi:glycosyltransferase involved in cell wall biosynthesis
MTHAGNSPEGGHTPADSRIQMSSRPVLDLRPGSCPGEPASALRVLHFRSTFTFAGPERSILTLALPLRGMGVKSKIIAYYRRRPPEPATHWLVEEGRCEGLDVEQWDDHSRFSWRAVRRLADQLAGGGYDLLVTHDHKSDLMGYLAARRAAVPCLATAHGYDLSLLRMILYRRVDLVTLRGFPRIVAVSESIGRELVAAGLSPDRIRVIPNAIDVARFERGAADRAGNWRSRFAGPGATVILTVGRLYRQKGPEWFVQCAARIHRVMPRARFWIVGDGPLRAHLTTQVGSLGLRGVVTLLGQQRDVAGIVAASDVFVMPSLGEGLSNVLLEAMALAKPVVATRVGGTPEVVRDAETGWLVPPGEPEALAAAVLRVLENRERADRIGRQGRELVASRFEATHVAARMAATYRQTVALARGGSS